MCVRFRVATFRVKTIYVLIMLYICFTYLVVLKIVLLCYFIVHVIHLCVCGVNLGKLLSWETFYLARSNFLIFLACC